MGMGRLDWRCVAERCLLLLVVGVSFPLVSGQTQCGVPKPKPQFPYERTEPRANCSNMTLLRQPFFGDLHVHSGYSFDADIQGTRLGPDAAYDFAKGATIDIPPYDLNGNALRTLTIDRPLDFAMVSDHAEFLGERQICNQEPAPPCPPGSPDPYCSQFCNTWRQGGDPSVLQVGLRLNFVPPSHPFDCSQPGDPCYDEAVTLWGNIQQAASMAYDDAPTCDFTTFVGYEWSMAPGAGNLHRNVLFRNADVTGYPTSTFEAPGVTLLWDALENDCVDDGPGGADRCQFLTVPHNSNLSAGTFFDTTGYDQAQAQRRQDLEPVIEIMQHKGQSECTSGIPNASSPADELCAFEVLKFNDLIGPFDTTGGSWNDPLPQDFVRDALKEGMAFEQSNGANPFKYGMVGGTDTHLDAPGAVSEDNYPGHGGAGGSTETLPPGLADHRYFNPGGLTVVWAEENSRDALYEAMRRREVYATSGTRLEVRFFGGFNFDLAPDMCGLSNKIQNADALGVPMGGDLPEAPVGESPRFFLNAKKDPIGADLDRIQIIKGWVDGGGTTHEKVYGSDSFPLSCGNESPGSAEWCCVWTDPDFDAAERAFYYARVVEVPTLRWHRRECIDEGIICPVEPGDPYEACCDGSVPDTIQERAWTSPIWYAP